MTRRFACLTLAAPLLRGEAPSDPQIVVIDPSKDFGSKGYEKIPAPRVRMQVNVASSTRVPWVDANGWRFQKGIRAALYSELPAGTGALAAAEAFSYGARALLRPEPADLENTTKMVEFVRTIPAVQQPMLANIGLVKTGSPHLDEVMNLFTRRNLLFQLVERPDPKFDLTVKLGSSEFPEQEATNPHEFALKVRQKLTDDRRLLRIYNSDVTIGHITGDARGARVHLLNYLPRPARELRVRVLGEYRPGTLYAFGRKDAKLLDFTNREGGTEFTVPELNTYAVIDLAR